MNRRLISFFLIALTLLPLPAAALGPRAFDGYGHRVSRWAEQAYAWAAQSGWILGKTGQTMDPDG